jgi:7-keto-8-aminopelargonate synthetase-like enzyme
MDQPIHRFRHNTKAIALGNPGWEEARAHHLIDLQVRVDDNDRLVMADSGFEFINLSSCSYLGLHYHPALLEGAIDGLRRAKVLDEPISRVRIRLTMLDELEAKLGECCRSSRQATCRTVSLRSWCSTSTVTFR